MLFIFSYKLTFCRVLSSMVRTCPDFGPFLYLPTHTRSCYRCSYPRPEYGLARVADVCLHFGPKQKDIISHPVIYNIEPPRYRFGRYYSSKSRRDAASWKS
ncbi:hypothetical protein BDV35DRAFT_337619 [Aspergillus flavus]|uniref:Uncharacterized protein n=1 Tax=Aspergillus flavus TaxID=5059 RepID=A0A5N6HDQ6_ASPFL|nr:hypothetical protein BDV35DRAFT_337619 [Aspergillus flavus]